MEIPLTSEMPCQPSCEAKQSLQQSPPQFTRLQNKPGHSFCFINGWLEDCQFIPSDLKEKRHRCRICARAVMASWRRRNPHRLLWIQFVQRARKYFGHELVSMLDLRWQTAGVRCLTRLMADAELHHSVSTDSSPKSSYYVITWKKEATFIDTNELVLVPRHKLRGMLSQSKARLLYVKHGLVRQTDRTAATINADGDLRCVISLLIFLKLWSANILPCPSLSFLLRILCS